MAAPIAILSFNRPQFLEAVLASMRRQRFVDLDAHEAHLFQDGEVNRYSRLRHAREEDTEACVALFQQAFPNGIVHRSGDNIGVCENFLRAETYLFEERGFECAWFFEDDLVLSPAYFAMMEALETFAHSRPDVGYFAAYGDHYLPKSELFARRRDLGTLDHHWGFGVKRQHWRAMQALLKPFYDIVVGEDYSRRDHRAILALYADQPIAPPASSQDAAKAIASDRLGVWRCNTLAPFARYIGRTGLHMTEAQFDQMGFARTVVLVDPVTLHFPGVAETRQKIDAQHNTFKAIRQMRYDELIQPLPARKLNPSRTLGAAELSWLCACLPRPDTDRPSLDAIEGFAYSRHLIESSRDGVQDWPPLGRPCGRDDVDMIYRLFLHRQPDTEKVYDDVGKRDVCALAAIVCASRDCQELWAKIVRS